MKLRGSQSFSRLSLYLGILLFTASFAAGCAIYDAYANDPEDSGNNGGGCRVNIDADFDGSGCSCDGAADVSSLFGSDAPPALTCSEGERCDGVVAGRQTANAACLSEAESDDCSVRQLEEYGTSSANFMPCDTDEADYHISARPGGFVVSGCERTSMTDRGLRVMWFDYGGRFETGETLNQNANAQSWRIRGMKATSANNVALISEVRTSTSTSLRGVFLSKGGGSGGLAGATNLGPKPECGERVEDVFDIVRVGNDLVYATCAENGAIRTTRVTVEDGVSQSGGGELSSDAGDLQLQSLAVVRSNPPTFRVLTTPVGIGDDSPLATTVYEGSTGESITFGAGKTFDSTQTTLMSPSTSDSVDGSILALANSTPQSFVFAGPTSMDRPTVFVAQDQTGGPRQLLGVDQPKEYVVDLVFDNTKVDNVLVEPQAAYQNQAQPALFLLTHVVDADGSNSARLYGMTPSLEVVWMREVGTSDHFEPQHLAVSTDPNGAGSIAVSGRGDQNKPRLVFLDLMGRGFCPLNRLTGAMPEGS